MSAGRRPPTDYRRRRKRSERQLLFLVMGSLVCIGGALIAAFYGVGGLLAGLPWLVAGAGTILVLYLLLVAAEWWTNR